jgi:hypothetical protein
MSDEYEVRYGKEKYGIEKGITGVIVGVYLVIGTLLVLPIALFMGVVVYYLCIYPLFN